MQRFSTDFYVTGATVIPVLYLALTLQGSTMRDVMTRWRKVNKDSAWTTRDQARAVSMAILSIAAGFVTLAGVVGEYAALQALYTEKVGPTTRVNVYFCCMVLLVAVAVGPVSWFVRAFFGTLADDARGAAERVRARLASEEQANVPHGISAESEPDRT